MHLCLRFPVTAHSTWKVQCSRRVWKQNNCTTSTIYVLQGNHGSLLNYKTASDLRVIDIRIKQVDHSDHHTLLAYEQLVQQYPNLFKGIGKLKNVEVKLHIDQTVPPVAQPARRIPFHMRKHVAAELNSLRKTRDNWESRWTYSTDISFGHNSQDEWRCSIVCWYENGKQGNQSRTTPESYSRWPDSHPQWSHDILETRLTLRISPIVPSTREQIHNHIRHPQRPEKVHQIESWYQFGKWDIPEHHQWANSWHSKSIEHQRWCHPVRKNPGCPWQSPASGFPEIFRYWPDEQVKVWV